MMRINKLTDYGIVVMTEIASMKSDTVHTAKVISHRTKIPLPTVTRLLKTLSNKGLLDSQRGSQGGFLLNSIFGGEKLTKGKMILMMLKFNTVLD